MEIVQIAIPQLIVQGFIVRIIESGSLQIWLPGGIYFGKEDYRGVLGFNCTYRSCPPLDKEYIYTYMNKWANMME